MSPLRNSLLCAPLALLLAAGCSSDPVGAGLGNGNGNGGDAGKDTGASGSNGSNTGGKPDSGAATGTTRPPLAGCMDADGDGFGKGCAAGEDCNDDDPAIGGLEICDALDNDCDGEIDEFLVDVCNVCDENCVVNHEGGPSAPWEPKKSNSDSVVVDDDGAITLGTTEMSAFSVWVANAGDGTVSKLDSTTNVELARYPSVRLADVDDLGDSPPNPSRTAVDQNFDAYVANRAHGNDDSQATVTKYSNDESGCVDRNGNGVIDTSSDVNGDGSIDVTDAGEYIGQDDECILWTVKVGAKGANARALAVGPAPADALVGNLYVGLYGSKEVCRLDAATGATAVCVDAPGMKPYGAAADGQGRIWYAGRDDSVDVGYLDLQDMWHAVQAPPNCNSGNPHPYGLTVDADSRVYFVASNCDVDSVYRYTPDASDPETGTWEQTTIPTGGNNRGIATSEEHVFVAISNNSPGDWGPQGDRIEQFDISDLSHIATHRMPQGRGPVGVGVSFDGSIWAVAQGSNLASRMDLTRSTDCDSRVCAADPMAAGCAADANDCKWIEQPVGATPYTYSDFIGFGLNVFADPRGYYRYVVEGCGNGTLWQGVEHDSEIPAGTSVTIFVRAAETRKALADAEWLGPFKGNPADLEEGAGPVPSLAFLEVEVRLSTDDRTKAPRVFGVNVVKECAIAIQ